MINLMTAIQSLRPNAECVVRDSDIEWLDSNQTQPTDAEIQTELDRLQAEYDANQYQRDRAAEYPSMEEQLDYIYHNGIEAWKADMILPVKDKYPKQ